MTISGVARGVVVMQTWVMMRRGQNQEMCIVTVGWFTPLFLWSLGRGCCKLLLFDWLVFSLRFSFRICWFIGCLWWYLKCRHCREVYSDIRAGEGSKFLKSPSEGLRLASSPSLHHNPVRAKGELQLLDFSGLNRLLWKFLHILLEMDAYWQGRWS